jgi:hypothetical protein
MNISEAIGILRLHRKWEKGVDIVKISTEDLQLAMDTIIDLLDPEFIVGMTPNAWDLSFIRKLQIQIGKLPYHQGLDDGGFNDGLAQGFEQGAQWVWDNFKLEIK